MRGVDHRPEEWGVEASVFFLASHPTHALLPHAPPHNHHHLPPHCSPPTNPHRSNLKVHTFLPFPIFFPPGFSGFFFVEY